MLVFFSDIHLTDGTSGETINPGAFDIFADHVAELARKREACEVRIVLLGDGLDVIRSVRWLKSPTGTRPWDERGEPQERLTLDILRATLDENREALEFLADVPGRVASRTEGRVPAESVRLDYVLGNHDWIINRYRSTRELVAQRLNLQRPRYAAGSGAPAGDRQPSPPDLGAGMGGGDRGQTRRRPTRRGEGHPARPAALHRRVPANAGVHGVREATINVAPAGAA